MTIQNISSSQLRRAAEIKDKIESLQKELGRLLGSAPAAAGTDGGKKKRHMSASARRRIAAAQKARWAKIRAGK